MNTPLAKPGFVGSLLLTVLIAGLTELPAQGSTSIDVVAAKERLRLIGLGSYQLKKSGQLPVNIDDVELSYRAARNEDEELAVQGLFCLGQLCDEEFFQEVSRKRLEQIVDLTIDSLASENHKVSTAACRTIQRFDAYNRWTKIQFTEDLQGDNPTILTPAQSRRIVASGLAWAMEDEPAAQIRAGRLLWAVADNVGPQVKSEIARVLLTTIEAQQERIDKLDQRGRRGLDSLKGALAVAIPNDQRIAAEMVPLFLSDAQTHNANHWDIYSKANALRALGRCGVILRGEHRAEILDYLLTQVVDTDLAFMTTSGKRSPFYHRGVQAISPMIAGLDDAELERVKLALAKLRKIVTTSKSHFREMDEASIFKDSDAALALRRTKAKK